MRYDFPREHPLCGKSVACQCLKEKQARTDAQRIDAYKANLSPTEQEWTLDTWTGDDSKALEEAHRATAQGWGMWCFHGNVGVGKSGLLLGIVNKFLNHGEEAIYKVATQMLDQLRDSYATETFDEEMNLLRAVRVLAIDEMWRFSGTEWAKEKIFQLLDYRSRYWDRMLTVIATNEKPNYSDPLWSRFNNGQTSKIVHVTGRDQRPLAG